MKTLFVEIRDLILSARRTVSRGVDLIQVLTNFEIGRRIVEHEQQGTERAEYGKRLLPDLSKRLTDEFGNGFSKSNLEYMRRFYLMYQDRRSSIAQTVSGQFAMTGKTQTTSGKSAITIFAPPSPAQNVGIILCKKKHDALVEITLPKDANIHAKEYQNIIILKKQFA